jgi:hypothetical protein
MSPRKSATARAEREPASLPEVLIPPSQAQQNEKEAYWIQLIQEPEEFKAALATEDFFPMLATFPDAFWTDGRLSLYLYRLEDEGLAIRNAEGKKKYITIYHQPVDEDAVKTKFGGGKYKLYLKLDGRFTVREITFFIDGTPKAQAGQIVEVGGKEVPVGTSQVVPIAPEAHSDIAKVIDASAEANAKSQEMLTHAAKASIDMVREQATAASAPARNPLEDVKTLLEIVRPQPPAADPVQQELMKAIIAKAFAEPKVIEQEEKETPVEKTLEAIKELSGGLSLAELMKPAARAAAADPVAGWAPIVSTIGSVVTQFFEKLPIIQAQRIEALKHEIYLRQLADAQRTGQPAPAPPQAALPPAAPQPAHQPAAQAASVQAQNPDPAQLMNMLVQHICRGFDKAPIGEWGEQTAASMDFHFSNSIESLGISNTLANPEEVDKFVAGVPELAKRSEDNRWKKFRFDFLQYCIPRWGNLSEEEEEALIQRMAGLDFDPPKPGPQPVA